MNLPSIDLSFLVSLAETVGVAFGRGISRGVAAGFTGEQVAAPTTIPAAPALSGGTDHADHAGNACKIEGCTSRVRSKGLCSRHYQAERRRLLSA